MHTITIIIDGNTSPVSNFSELRLWVTLLVAFGALIVALAAYAREDRRDRASKSRQDQEQASNFAVWGVPLREREFYVMVKNASKLPIEDVRVYVWEEAYFGKYPFTVADMVDHAYKVIDLGVFGPKEARSIEVDFTGDPGNSARKHAISVMFQDQQGIRWIRHQGQLKPNPAETEKQPTWFRELELKPEHLLNPLRMLDAFMTLLATKAAARMKRAREAKKKR